MALEAVGDEIDLALDWMMNHPYVAPVAPKPAPAPAPRPQPAPAPAPTPAPRQTGVVEADITEVRTRLTPLTISSLPRRLPRYPREQTASIAGVGLAHRKQGRLPTNSLFDLRFERRARVAQALGFIAPAIIADTDRSSPVWRAGAGGRA